MEKAGKVAALMLAVIMLGLAVSAAQCNGQSAQVDTEATVSEPVKENEVTKEGAPAATPDQGEEATEGADMKAEIKVEPEFFPASKSGGDFFPASKSGAFIPREKGLEGLGVGKKDKDMGGEDEERPAPNAPNLPKTNK